MTTIYVAIDSISHKGPTGTVTTHDTLEGAKKAIHFRLQCDAEDVTLEWETLYIEGAGGLEPIGYEPKGRYSRWAEIKVTTLNNKF